MVLRVDRDIFNKDSTLGKLFIDDEFFCYTVEDTVRDYNNDGDLDDKGEDKVYGETAIPKGEYKVKLSLSNRFKKVLPEVLEVKGFAGIRIHAGNTAIDSHGCVIVGMDRTVDGVEKSRIAMDKLIAKMLDKKDIKLIIG